MALPEFMIMLLAMSARVSADDGPSNFANVVAAHGILGTIAWIFFFPLGIILLRTLKGPKTWLIHASVQICALVIIIASASMGIWAAVIVPESNVINQYHPIIGLVCTCAVILQPVSGYIHHIIYLKKAHRTVVSYIHVWMGRLAVTVAMINGGLASLWAGDFTRSENIGYGVIAGLIWTVMMVVGVSAERKQGAPEKFIIEQENQDMHKEGFIGVAGDQKTYNLE